jgi:hypothetical protein
MPNVENIRAVQAAILAQPEHFDMSRYFTTKGVAAVAVDEVRDMPAEQFMHTCGTAMCIAGFAAAVAFPNASIGSLELNIPTVGRDFLGIGGSAASDLFTPGSIHTIAGQRATMVEWALAGSRDVAVLQPLLETNAEVALHVLDILAETGKVDWFEAYRRAGHPATKPPADATQSPPST